MDPPETFGRLLGADVDALGAGDENAEGNGAGEVGEGDGDECERRADGDGRLRHHSDVD